MSFFVGTGFSVTALHVGLFILRVLISAFIMTHGVPKFAMILDGGEIQFGDPVGLGPAVSLYLSAFAEFLCAAFLLIGLGSRIALIPLIINMSVAAFIAHAGQPFANKELALLFLTVFIFLYISGPGKYSIDHFFEVKKKDRIE